MFWKRKKPEEPLTVSDLMEYGREEAARLVAIERAQYELQQEQHRQRVEQERLLREQERQDKEQRRQAEQLAKHERRIADLEFRMNQAEEDVDNLAWRIEEQQKYSVYLQEQRDKCISGSPEYFKWQNRLTMIDNRIYQLDKQRKKAEHIRDMAKKEIGVA